MASKKSIYFVTLVHQLWWDSKPVHQEASRSNPFSFFVYGSHCLFKCLLLQEYARTSIRFSFSFWYVSPIWSSFPWQMLSLSIEQKSSAHIPCRNVCVGLSLNVNRPSMIIRGLGRRWTWPVSRRRLFIEKKRDAHFWTSCFLLLLLGVPRLGGDGPMRKPGRHPIDNLTWTCLIRNRKKKGSRGSGNTWRRRRLRSTWTKGQQQQRCLHIRWPLPWQQHHSLKKKKKKIFYLIFFFLRSIRWSVPSGQDFDLTPHQLSNVDVQFL